MSTNITTTLSFSLAGTLSDFTSLDLSLGIFITDVPYTLTPSLVPSFLTSPTISTGIAILLLAALLILSFAPLVGGYLLVRARSGTYIINTIYYDDRSYFFI